MIIISVNFLACSKKSENTDKIKIVVSILPLAEFTEQVGGDRVEVSTMVPAGITPHSYEPAPAQLAQINETQIYVKVGTSIEFEIIWFDKIRALNNGMLICNASEDISLLGPDVDPHVWLSPLNAQLMVEKIYRALVEIDVKNKNYYSRNKEKYLEKLRALDEYIEESLKTKKNRKFLIYHPAWGYFARDYDLKQIPVEKEGKEPTAKQILQVIEQAKKENIRVVFASPQFNTRSAQVIAREIQGKVILIDPLEKKYISNIIDIVEQLVEIME